MPTADKPDCLAGATPEELRAEVRRLREQLLETAPLAALGRLLVQVVHEINTPIGSILSNNHVIRRTLDSLKSCICSREASDPSNRRALDLTETFRSLTAVDQIACERIAGVVRTLKIFARSGEPQLEKISLNEHLCNTVKLVEIQVRKRIEMVRDFGELPQVEAYPQQLNQVFLNILTNAAEAIPGQGRITVNTALDGEAARIRISDTGTGIPAESLARLFKPGFTTKPPGAGLGVGLALCREIIEDRHQGSIRVESQPGAGTTFEIRIPVKAPATKPHE